MHALTDKFIIMLNSLLQPSQPCFQLRVSVKNRADVKFCVTRGFVLHTRNKLVTLWVNSINNKQFQP